MKRTRQLLTLATTLTLLCLAQISLAQGNSQNAGNGNGNSNSNAGGNGIGKAFGRSRNIGVGNASDGIKGASSPANVSPTPVIPWKSVCSSRAARSWSPAAWSMPM
ncbi:MAG: hypothetical protein ACE37N_02300 [Pseudohongiellaceae bacterium]